ncbi:hypothetical protein [Limnohabitans sp.]|uniref:hypothetical protein n=1 Tax=Limnohabitans sp. TaxID=1907725 RepID=UPI0035B232B7
MQSVLAITDFGHKSERMLNAAARDLHWIVGLCCSLLTIAKTKASADDGKSARNLLSRLTG